MTTLVIIVTVFSLLVLQICPLFSFTDLGFAKHAGSLLHHPLGVAEVRVRIFVGPSRALSAELRVVFITGGFAPVLPRPKEMVDLCLLEIGRVLRLKFLKERKLFRIIKE